jgi:tetratricopeptide (TPR) repeat protein
VSRIKLGQFGEAIADFNASLAESPAVPTAYIERAVAYGATGEDRRALDDLDAALRLDPGNLRVHWVRGAIRELLEDFEGAASDYTECIRRDPKDVRFLLARGSVYARLMKYVLALQDRDDAVKLAPSNASARLERSESYYHFGQLEKALADTDSAIAIAPGLSQAWRSRGATYLKLGRNSEALADLVKAFRLDPRDSSTGELLAQAQRGLSEAAAETQLARQERTAPVAVPMELPTPPAALEALLREPRVGTATLVATLGPAMKGPQMPVKPADPIDQARPMPHAPAAASREVRYERQQAGELALESNESSSQFLPTVPSASPKPESNRQSWTESHDTIEFSLPEPQSRASDNRNSAHSVKLRGASSYRLKGDGSLATDATPRRSPL